MSSSLFRCCGLDVFSLDLCASTATLRKEVFPAGDRAFFRFCELVGLPEGASFVACSDCQRLQQEILYGNWVLKGVVVRA
jgi:hypothetical protein